MFTVIVVIVVVSFLTSFQEPLLIFCKKNILEMNLKLAKAWFH